MNWTLIHKYLSGQCTDAERTKVEQWLNENPDHKIFMDSVTKIWNVAPKEEKKVDVEAAWRLFHSERMEPVGTRNLAGYRTTARYKNYQPHANVKWYKKTPAYAAAAAIALLVAVFLSCSTG